MDFSDERSRELTAARRQVRLVYVMRGAGVGVASTHCHSSNSEKRAAPLPERFCRAVVDINGFSPVEP